MIQSEIEATVSRINKRIKELGPELTPMVQRELHGHNDVEHSVVLLSSVLTFIISEEVLRLEQMVRNHSHHVR